MSEPMITATHENGNMDPVLAKALVALLADMPAIQKDSENPHFGNTYASLGAIREAVRPFLKKHGFALVQTTLPSLEGVSLETHLIHESGSFLTSRLLMPVAQKGNPQAIGSALSYGLRYSAAAMLSLVIEDDDDGNAAAAPARPAAPAPRTTTQPMPAAQAAPAPEGSNLWHGIIDRVGQKMGETRGKPWVVFFIHGRDGERFSTFDVKWANTAKFLVGSPARIAWLQGRKGKDVFSIEATTGQEATAPPPDDPFGDEEPPPF